MKPAVSAVEVSRDAGSVTQALAARVVATTFDQLTPGALAYARLGLLDTLAIGIAGSNEDAPRIAYRVTGATPGPALL